MPGEIIDLRAVRIAKDKLVEAALDAEFARMEGVSRRQAILEDAIRKMADFSSADEIADTLCFAVEVLEAQGR